VSSGLTKVWNRSLDGAVYASPIVAQGQKIVVTENNTVYRIVNGAVSWSHHLGPPVPQSELPCGDIDPTGITSTPVYDAATSTVVVVALLDHPIRHVAYGFDPRTGTQRWSRPVDVPTSVPGTTPAAMQQRGALLVRDRHVYIAYGGLAGDCSSYRGSVVALDLEHPVTGALADFTIPTSREAGIWAPAGLAASPAGGILVADGNGATAETGTYDQSDSVLRLVNNKIVDSFTPSTWRDDNRDDLDLGSQGPTVIGKWVFIAGKRGTAYVLDGAHLGGIGGQVSQMSLCASYGGTATSGSTVFVPCKDGVRAVRINANGTMTVLWHAASSVTGSPVVGGGRIWSLDSDHGVLYALDPATGATRGHWAVGAVNRFATPALYRNTILIGTLTSIVCLSWT
jgi:outer membrane protein assembly factor BamB